jgi:hypothetical protein
VPLRGIDSPLITGKAGSRAQSTHRLILGTEAQTSMVGTKEVKLGEPQGIQWLLHYPRQGPLSKVEYSKAQYNRT